MNDTNQKDSQQNVDNELDQVPGTIPKKRLSPAMKALITEEVTKRKYDALRNGVKATAYKQQQRDAYEQMIMDTEGREVRSYEKFTSEEVRLMRRRAQKAKSKANRSPAQIEKEREADRLRKTPPKEDQIKAMEAHPDFGKFG
jgi:hypothetical protein